MTHIPSFLICGAMRSGTTLLWNYCTEHPEIEMAQSWEPEPKFFNTDDFHKGLDWYIARWWDRTGPVMGEKSISYMDTRACAERIAATLPDVKLVFILRDPVTRAWSQYQMQRQRFTIWDGEPRPQDERLSFTEALDLELARNEMLSPFMRDVTRPFAYAWRGMYADRLEAYFDLFARDKILIMFYERLRCDPTFELGRLCEFFGVDFMKSTLPRINTWTPDDPIPMNCRRRLAWKFNEPNRRLASLLNSTFPLAWLSPRDL